VAVVVFPDPPFWLTTAIVSIASALFAVGQCSPSASPSAA